MFQPKAVPETTLLAQLLANYYTSVAWRSAEHSGLSLSGFSPHWLFTEWPASPTGPGPLARARVLELAAAGHCRHLPLALLLARRLYAVAIGGPRDHLICRSGRNIVSTIYEVRTTNGARV